MISILGGTFDPIHNAHLYVANAVMHKIKPHKILFIPNAVSPHRKLPLATTQQRATMLTLALKEFPYFEMSPIEIERCGPSYMIDTVKIIHALYPKEDITLIVGLDAYCRFTDWLHFEKILEYSRLIVVDRHTTSDNFTPHLSDQIIPSDAVYHLKIDPCPISATQIRQCIAKGESINGLVPPAVARYIIENKLYQSVKTR